MERILENQSKRHLINRELQQTNVRTEQGPEYILREEGKRDKNICVERKSLFKQNLRERMYTSARMLECNEINDYVQRWKEWKMDEIYINNKSRHN